MDQANIETDMLARWNSRQKPSPNHQCCYRWSGEILGARDAVTAAPDDKARIGARRSEGARLSLECNSARSVKTSVPLARFRRRPDNREPAKSTSGPISMTTTINLP
jgi:hypothetical protein